MTPSEIAETLIREICYLGNGDVYRDATKGRFVGVISKAITEAVEEERRACIGVVRNFSPTENQRRAFVIGGVRGVFGSMQNAFADAIEARGKKA